MGTETSEISKAVRAFRAELVKIMPGYDWTVHRATTAAYLDATGTQSSGFNRLSTLSVTRKQHGDALLYRVASAGHGARAPWIKVNTDGTLARALRGLQDAYEYEAAKMRSCAARLEAGRRKPEEATNG